MNLKYIYIKVKTKNSKLRAKVSSIKNQIIDKKNNSEPNVICTRDKINICNKQLSSGVVVYIPPLLIG